MATHPIMVVDDDDDVRNMLCVVLSAEGYDTVGAADGIEALRRIRGGDRPALVFVDLMMPRMDGEALIRTMRRDPSLAEIPVAVLSGHTRGGIDDQRSPLVDARLVKPVELQDLLAVAEKFAGPVH